MISNNPAEPQASPASDAKDGKDEAHTPVLDPRDKIEVASGGTGTVTDPSGSGTKPPGFCDLDLFA